MPKTPNVKRPARRWWQRICRILVALGMFLAAAYITLPWWAPPGVIRRHLIEQMSSQLGLDVRIEEVSMSWDQGIELKGLQIDSPAGFSPDSEGVMLIPLVGGDVVRGSVLGPAEGGEGPAASG